MLAGAAASSEAARSELAVGTDFAARALIAAEIGARASGEKAAVPAVLPDVVEAAHGS